jgi:hypothetical protein
MGRAAKHDWNKLLGEYMKSSYQTKTDFAQAKGINASLLRRNTTHWPDKRKGEVTPQQVKKNKSNVTKKDNNVTEQKVTQTVTKLVTLKNPENPKATNQKPPLSNDEIKSSGRFCAAHAKNRPGGLCTRPAGWGTPHPGTGRCKFHGGCSPGGPKGNKHAVSTGEFETIFGNLLEDDERAWARDLNLDTLSQVDNDIQLITVREHRMLKRIKRLRELNGDESGHTTVEYEATIKEIKSKKGETETLGERKLTKEKNEGILGQIIHIEEALTRVQEKKARLLELKHRIETTTVMDNHKVKIDTERLKIERERLEIEKIKANLVNPDDEETGDDGFIEAIKGSVPSIWANELSTPPVEPEPVPESVPKSGSNV